MRNRLVMGIPLGRVFGVPVNLSVSLLVLAVMVAFWNGQLVHQQRPALPTLAAYGLGLAFVAGLIASVLLHELGHALTARRCGVGVRGITLELLGGYTELDRDAPSPRVEFVVAVVGPAISLLVGLIMVGVTALTPANTLGYGLAFQLAVANLIVAVFNALPGLPLDGGRALQAGVWRVTGDRHRGTEAAGWAGRIVAVLTVLAGYLLFTSQRYSQFGLIFALLVAMTLWTGATQAIRIGRVGRRVPLLRIDKLAHPLYAVPTGTPLAEAERQVSAIAVPGAAIGVRDGHGRVVAVVRPEAAAAVPPERRPWLPVDSVARSVAGTLPLSLAGEDIVRAVQARPAEEYLVTSGDDVVGVFRTADLARTLQSRETNR